MILVVKLAIPYLHNKFFNFGVVTKYKAKKYAKIPKIILINQIGITVLFLKPIPNFLAEPSLLKRKPGLNNTTKVKLIKNKTTATKFKLFFTKARNIIYNFYKIFNLNTYFKLKII